MSWVCLRMSRFLYVFSNGQPQLGQPPLAPWHRERRWPRSGDKPLRREPRSLCSNGEAPTSFVNKSSSHVVKPG